MKTTDHNIETLRRHLKEEAVALRQRAKRLDVLAAAVNKDVKDGTATVHSFEFVAQEAIGVITHRSNVHPESIARVCASLAADAAIEWAKGEAVRLHAALGHVCDAGSEPNCGYNPCIEHRNA